MRISTVLLFLGLSVQLRAQTPAKRVYTITADSVKITNCDSSELIIENHTQNVPGFLFNTGNGRTVFQRGAQRLGNGTYLIGADTLYVTPKAWVQGGNQFDSTAVLGTLDSNHLDLFTSGARRARLTDTGNFIIGDTVDNGQRLQVNGTSYFNNQQFVTGTFNCPGNVAFSEFNPTINTQSGYFQSAYGVRLAPTFNFNGNSQSVFALEITPTFNLGSYTPRIDHMPSAVHITSSLAGVWIDQPSSVPGGSGQYGQPLVIYQSETSDIEAILNTRAFNTTTRPFIWNLDTRPDTTSGLIIPALASSVTSTTAVRAGAGVSFTLDRELGTDASIDMHYETTPDFYANVNTSMAFNTHSSTLGAITPLYLNGPNVGMGTTTPTAQLHTTGSVRFAGITQDST